MAGKKQVKEEDAPVAEASGNCLTRLLFRPRVLMLLAAGLVLSAVVPMSLEKLPDLRSQQEFQFHLADVDINHPPRYVPANLVEQVAAQSTLPETLSILDQDLVDRIARAFSRHPWVAEVLEVKKGHPARVTVTLRYRRPVAMVEVQQGLYPIDADGRLLPPADFAPADAKRYPLIQNIRSTPAGPAGTLWGEMAVTAAAQVARALENDWSELNLAAIRAPHLPQSAPSLDDLQFELRTRGGTRILWGRAPGSNHPAELAEDQKIDRLKKYLTDFGSFDGPHGPYEIDIRHWREISRRKIGARSAERRRRGRQR